MAKAGMRRPDPEEKMHMERRVIKSNNMKTTYKDQCQKYRVKLNMAMKKLIQSSSQ